MMRFELCVQLELEFCKRFKKEGRPSNFHEFWSEEVHKTSPRAHTESELDVLGVPNKLVKYVVHLFKRRN
jgi:hypothetical protein